MRGGERREKEGERAPYHRQQMSEVPRDGRLHLLLRRRLDQVGRILLFREQRVLTALGDPRMCLVAASTRAPPTQI